MDPQLIKAIDSGTRAFENKIKNSMDVRNAWLYDEKLTIFDRIETAITDGCNSLELTNSGINGNNYCCPFIDHLMVRAIKQIKGLSARLDLPMQMAALRGCDKEDAPKIVIDWR